VRLTPAESQAIREEIHRLDSGAEIHLFGSRADDTARGGDIDLLVISDRLTFRDLMRLRAAILDRIGWQQLDLLVKTRKQLRHPLVCIALETGVRL